MKILYSYANLSKTRCFLEKFTQLAQILHDRRSRQPWQISSLRQRKLKAPQRVNSLKMRTHKHMAIRNFHHSRLWWYKYTYISEVMIRFSELQLEEAMKIGVAFFGSQRLWVYVWKDFWELFHFLGEEKSDRKSKHGCVKPSFPLSGNANNFSASYNSNNSLTFQQSTWVIFSAVELSQKFAIESSEKISNSDMLVNRLNSREIRSAWTRDWLRGTDLQTDYWAHTNWFKDWLLQLSARQEREWVDELLGERDCSSCSVRLFLYCFLSVTESGAAWRNRKFQPMPFLSDYCIFCYICDFCIFCVFCLLEKWIMAVLVLAYRVSRDLSEKWYTLFNISFLFDLLFSFSFEKW